MTRADAVIVGGGPAGSTCARALRHAGWDVLVVDRARFPRDKVCAGWLTPDVFSDLDLLPDDYAAAGLTLQRISMFRTGVIRSTMIETTYPRIVSYGILRREFDQFLLQRSGARVSEGTPVATLRRTHGAWIINENLETPIVVGAGGHFCPVARLLRGGADTTQPIVAKEAEFVRRDRASGPAAHSPSLFFCRDLQGYGWCVPKGDYLNVGIGRRDRQLFSTHVTEFVAFLEAQGIHAGDADVRWHGHAYLASGSGPRPLIDRGVVLIGDAAGLAYPESGEGIHPSIQSGQLAAETLIAARGRREIDDLQPYADAIRAAHPAVSRTPAPVRGLAAIAGRLLLRSPAFTRHVVLDRWFLRSRRPHTGDLVATGVA
jgi:geranylgeranyl reductase family protein